MRGDAERGDVPPGVMDGMSISRLRARLASFEHAYAVALRVQQATGRCQFISRTGNALQPVRTSHQPPCAPEILLAIIG